MITWLDATIMAEDRSIREPEAQEKLGGSQYPGNEEDPVDASVHGGCGLPALLLLIGLTLLLI